MHSSYATIQDVCSFCVSPALHGSTTESLEYDWLTATGQSSHVVYYSESSLFRVHNISTKPLFSIY